MAVAFDHEETLLISHHHKLTPILIALAIMTFNTIGYECVYVLFLNPLSDLEDDRSSP